MRYLGRTIAGIICVARIASAQHPLAVTQRSSPLATADGSGAFVLEALGGSVGALAGIAIVGLSSTCGHEDLGCVIRRVGAGGVAGAVGAALGAVVGTGVGLGVHYLFNRDSDRNLGDGVVVPIFVISQGTLSALGSRILGAAHGER